MISPRAARKPDCLVSEVKLIIERVKKLKIKKPTFVASDKKFIKLCQYLSHQVSDGANFAYISQKNSQYGKNLVLHGHLNPNVILIENRLNNKIRKIDDYDLVKCAGGRTIYAVYSPPAHPMGKIHKTKAEANSYEEEIKKANIVAYDIYESI